MEQGCYVGGIPSYGYFARWINGKKVLFPEEEASDVVRNIYRLFDEGKRIREIIFWLYEQHVNRPSDYKRVGHVHSKEEELLKQWSDQTIRTILTNPVYIGTLVQIRVGDKIYRNGDRHNIEPDEVITVEHTHEIKLAYLIQRAETKYRRNRRNKGFRHIMCDWKSFSFCGNMYSFEKRILKVNPPHRHLHPPFQEI